MNEDVKKIIIDSDNKPVTSIADFIQRIRDFLLCKSNEGSNTWIVPWFRGECITKENIQYYDPLLPKLYRASGEGDACYNENKLLQHFRMKAPVFSSELVPERGETDKWLFLAQHVGLPTRLLDWTESAIVALYFALKENRAENRFVWMLDPISLNRVSAASKTSEFPLTWYDPGQTYDFNYVGEWVYDSQGALRFKPDEKNTQKIEIARVGEWQPDEKGDVYFYPKPNINIGNINIRGAWEKDGPGTEFPVAILPTNIHPRMSVQRSCFTIHGKKKESLAELAAEYFPEHLNCYMISSEAIHLKQMHEDLQMLGITHSALFPDLDGLAVELQDLDYYKRP